MRPLIWICAAGALGTGTRYAIAVWAAGRLGASWPYGTFIVNVAGCFAATAVMHAALALGWPPVVRTAVMIGFLGGLTTYSTFTYETVQLIENGARMAALVNVVLTTVATLVAAVAGLITARALVGP